MTSLPSRHECWKNVLAVLIAHQPPPEPLPCPLGRDVVVRGPDSGVR